MMEHLNEALCVTCKLRKANHNLKNISGEQADADLKLLNQTTSALIKTSCKWVRIHANYTSVVSASAAATLPFSRNVLYKGLN